MAVKHNNAILQNHFKKDWQKRVRVHFDQAGKKASRRTHRAQRAAAIAPRPLDSLRPIVRAPTLKYNRKLRLGRGFSLEELKAAGIPKKYAKTIGIAVDHRRQNRNVEALDANVNRLKEYMSKLIVFPRQAGKPKNGDATDAEIKAATQQFSINEKFPISQDPVVAGTRAISSDEKNGKTAYQTLLDARVNKKEQGKREKARKEKEALAAEKKK